ncbi:MMPL family transporter [Janibacter melonis]|uniref:MMPL family transporter n=1 Tax=Janibacter melonis TaxID=262209 RepID=UPI0020436EBE|nr:MMPL family transporter [Janibacter melonis]MCM3555610.1 MMPL family transporter [Janibacter melonis]
MRHRVAALITGRRSAWAVIVLGLVLIGLVMSLGAGERQATPTDSLPRGYDSTAAAELREQLPEQDGAQALVLFTADDGTIDKAELPELAKAAGLGEDATVVPSEDGTAAITFVPIETTDSPKIRDAVRDLRAELDERTPEGITAEVTGPAGITADLAAVFDGADTRLLLSTASIVAVLLILTYRSPVLWIIPLTVIGAGDRTATVAATQVLERLGMTWDDSTTGILSVLVFGAGTNYALLLMSRYRDALRVTEDRREALTEALAKTFEPVLASATTVVVGVLCLLLSLTPGTRGLGLASAIGIVIAVLSALVLLPAVLSLFGRWVFWPKVPHAGETTLSDGRSLWRRIGDAVARRPSVFVGGAVVLLAVMSAGVFSVRLGLPQSEQFLDKPEAIVAAERLAESFPAGSSDPAVIVTTADPKEVTRVAEGVDGIESVRPGASGDGVSELQAVLPGQPDSQEAEDAVVALRAAIADADLADTYVGGTTAEAVDVGDGAQRDRLLILPLILGLVLVALIALLRSLVAPLVLIATVMATNFAAIGVSWWIFTKVFGFSALDQITVLYAFLFLVALGVDYNIFLVTRAKEETREHGTREGMLRALAATGGVITSAGILLAAVFAVLGVLPLVVLAQIGVIICIGVLLDTLLVRTVVVPAITLLLGDRFWWPRKVS